MLSFQRCGGVTDLTNFLTDLTVPGSQKKVAGRLLREPDMNGHECHT
jgi:hypothetical protein